MAVTIKQIAEECNVSRGTVDRVLNNRGRVRDEIAALVREKAEELGYRPNMAGKALAARKKNYVIGIILTSEGVEFFDEVLNGIHKGQEEIADYGVTLLVRSMKGYHAERQLALMEEMKDKVQLLILNGINEERIAQKIQEYMRDGIPVITINADVENSGRLCYVGCDFNASGRTAGGILGLLSGGRATIGIATGTVKVLGHNQRIHGFSSLCKERYPRMKIADIIETNDDDEAGYEQTCLMLKRYPEISAIYIVAAGAAGVCRAVEESGRAASILVVASDNTNSVREWMKKGIIRAAVCQNPYGQGYRAVQRAADYLIQNITPTDYIAKNEIRILENIDE
ncbi:MAG: LacI family DNA-binding transcriptional regulator [Lachnospiraceae bacterium]|nr:LacI family DNA-binding transcriptional regulator [Lachnospiraceae bacterium]